MFAVFRRAGSGLGSKLRSRLVRFSTRFLFRQCNMLAVATALIVWATNFVHAAPLRVGESISVPRLQGTPSGTVVGGATFARFSASSFSGTLYSIVVINDRTNPFGTDKLTFVYGLTNHMASRDAIERLTIGSFDNTQIDVSTMPNTFHRIPSSADRSTGDVIGFNFLSTEEIFTGTLAPGQTTWRLYVQTDATSFAPSFASVINGSVTTVETFAPFRAIPEPSAFVLGSICIIAFIGLLWASQLQRTT